MIGAGACATGEEAGLLLDDVGVVDDAWPLMPATSKTTTQAPTRIALVREDHFVRTIRMTTVIGKNRMAATMTSQRGNPLGDLGEVDIGAGGKAGPGVVGAWLAGTHSAPVHHHC